MKKAKNLSTDGFISRSSSHRQTTKSADLNNSNDYNKTDRKALFSSFDEEIEKTKSGYGSSYFGSAPAEKSEKKIDKPDKKLSRRQRRRMENKLNKKPRRLIFRIIKWLLLLILLVALAIGGYTAYKLLSASNNMFQGSIIDIFNNKPLKADENGRSNFLVIGTSEDDPGHEAAYLTDSIMVISVSQTNKDVYMFSVPRDLNVKYGRACLEGYSGKINSYYECVNSTLDDTDKDAAAAEQERLSAMQELVGEVYGIDIQYSVHVNYTALKEVVDAVGGIDVDIEGSAGEPGVLDRNADWRCNYTCYYVKYDNGVHHLDGEHALYLALARGSNEDGHGTYGLSRSNPDREANQRKILIALKDKALSIGALTNLGTVSSLIDSLGNNLRTNIQTNEISTILQVASSIKTENMNSIDLMTEGVMNGNGNPTAGDYSYEDIQSFIAKKLSDNPVINEDALIIVLNGTDKAGLGQTEADSLRTAGYNIYYVDTAPDNTYGTTEVYQIGTDNSGTASALAKLFNVTVKTTEPPIKVDENARFVVVLGSDVLNQ
jgi:LCP family protein required for cell wall assembly